MINCQAHEFILKICLKHFEELNEQNLLYFWNFYSSKEQTKKGLAVH